MSKIVCFGEILWDVFPTHKKIGGAPLNVALRLSRMCGMDHKVNMISSIGHDKNGKKLLDYIRSNELTTNLIQINKTFKTGEVNVILDEKGTATYDIEFPCAWDHIQLDKIARGIVKNTDAFVFGSLSARNNVSRHTLFELLKIAEYKIFDVNLRAPHYTMVILNELMLKADLIKFNDDELSEICEQLDYYSKDVESMIKFISKATNTNHICVTLGEKGAVLFINNTFYKNNGYVVKVKDTVGAGDSFLAALISKLLNNKTPQEALDFACAIAAIVASSQGANPEITGKEIQKLLNR